MAEAPDTGAVASELRAVVGQLVRRLRARGSFPLSQGSVLGRLDREGPLSVSDLAHAERVRPQSMAQTVGDLEQAGLVSRRPDPHDGRRALVELTDAGREAVARERADRASWLALAIGEELTRGEQQALARALPLLRRLADR
ncbi:MAG TPA: MarR family transcriptional regulator [Thermoleophilaceae bacterium]|nr:MarR family transcriptional regulator [Thermoleophilaceae bacterium]